MKTIKIIFTILLSTILISSFFCSGSKNISKEYFPTENKGDWSFISKDDLKEGKYHTKHFEIFGKYVSGYNQMVLKAIDNVQATAMDGGGYFIGLKVNPAESPIGYELKLFNNSLIAPPRKTSYCSGSSYGAFIEALNLIFKDGLKDLSKERIEAMRMQEPDGGRREDGIKYWGHWNDDGFGSHFAMVQYSDMGIEIDPKNALPGDFMNISWVKGGGHSVVFLGWYIDEQNKKYVAFWSSQASTNGFSDLVSSLERVKEVKIVRLTKPENILKFNLNTPINRKVPGDAVNIPGK